MRSTSDVVDRRKSKTEPFSDPPLLVLTSLSEGPKHGHAMIEDIFGLCGTRLGPGTLYGAISRLEQQGWIEALPFDGRRQPYQLTAQGEAALRARLVGIGRLSVTGLRRLGVL